ncbi:MAG: YceI family protein [Actinomycetota bacterium]
MVDRPRLVGARVRDREARPRDREGPHTRLHRNDPGRRIAVDRRKGRRVNDHHETRDGHVQAPDFFDTDRYPELRFESTAVATNGDELIVEGDLTIKDVTKPIELKGRFVGAGVDPYGNDRIGLELAGTVDRTEFGLNWNAPLLGGDFLLPNEVVLRATLAAVKAA